MKNQNKEDEYIRQFITELGTEETSQNFHKAILNKLNNTKSVSVYKPVISSLGWKIIGVTIAAIFILVLTFVPGGNGISLFDRLPSLAIPTISLTRIPLPIIDISPIVIQALSTFTLLAFLVVFTSLRKVSSN